ncbi:hypothetical protein [Xenorhabdus cabanillasii]|uniref:hypothetical protein n=1 Tax=Xenorhabdus cabanillasii TaxID=351673 RepID=UPI0012EBB345|nr:hypothetical protein [Xenorhabdus cabanillasii]
MHGTDAAAANRARIKSALKFPPPFPSVLTAAYAVPGHSGLSVSLVCFFSCPPAKRPVPVSYTRHKMRSVTDYLAAVDTIAKRCQSALDILNPATYGGVMTC